MTTADLFRAFMRIEQQYVAMAQRPRRDLAGKALISIRQRADIKGVFGIPAQIFRLRRFTQS